MINLAIAVDFDRHNRSIIETNSGEILVSPDWPQDCESQVVSYRKGGREGHVVNLELLAEDIRQALAVIGEAHSFGRKRPDWFTRLQNVSAV